MNPFKTMGKVVDKELDDGGDSLFKAEDLTDGYFICERNAVVGGYKKMQGLIALTDATEKDGGFLTIPGFSANLEEWTKFHSNTVMGSKLSKRADFINVPEQDPLNKQAKPVPIRAGSVSFHLCGITNII
jgi:ectoine hydroxylase-related dioxygenase (phytanoyl-CoA dioxygenase family)